jgi:hypothetical protein
MDHDTRIAFWRASYAHASFQDARIFIEELLKLSLPLQDPIRKGLSISILTAYARPFKQRPKIKVPEDVLAPGYLPRHRELIKMRDKVVAHRDLDGPIADWGHISQIRFHVENNRMAINTYSPVFTDQAAKDLLPIVDYLIGKMRSEFEQAKEHFQEIIQNNGVYVLEVTDVSKPWFTKRLFALHSG